MIWKPQTNPSCSPAAVGCWQFATLKPGECIVYTQWNSDTTTAFFRSCQVGQFPRISGTDELGHTHEEKTAESQHQDSQEVAVAGDTVHVVPEHNGRYPVVLPR